MATRGHQPSHLNIQITAERTGTALGWVHTCREQVSDMHILSHFRGRLPGALVPLENWLESGGHTVLLEDTVRSPEGAHLSETENLPD